MWIVGEVTESQQKASGTGPSWTPPTHTASQCSNLVPHPGEYLRLCPLLHNRRTRDKKKKKEKEKMAQMKNQFKAPEKVKLSNEEIVNLSDTQFKTLIIRMLQELTSTV